MEDQSLTIQKFEAAISRVFEKEFDKAFDKAFKKSFGKAFDEAIDKAIDEKIEPLVIRIVDKSAEKIIADVGQAMDNFIASTDGRFTAIEYDVSKNKQDITALQKTASLALYRPR